MAWAKVDDQFHSHPKIEAAGNAAVGVYARCLSYCAAYYTDGFIRFEQARKFAGRREIEALTQNGLWIPVKPGESYTITGRRDTGRRPLPDVTVPITADGFLIVDFLHYHPTREEDETRRAARANAAQQRSNSSASESANARKMRSHTRPDPYKDLPSSTPTVDPGRERHPGKEGRVVALEENTLRDLGAA